MADNNEDQVLPVDGTEGADEETIPASAPVTAEEEQTSEKGSASSSEVTEGVKEDKPSSAEQKGPENSKPLSVDSIEVEFLHSIKFMHAGQYYDFRGGEKAKVSEDLYKILWERGCVKPVIR